MFIDTKLEPMNDHWLLEIRYDYPLGGKSHKVIIKEDTKLEAMKSYFSNASTVLSLRLDEFYKIVMEELAPKFKKESKNFLIVRDTDRWVNKFWEYYQFRIKLYENLHHSYGFCKMILDNKNIFKNVIPSYPILDGYKIQLVKLLDEIETLAKRVAAAELKVHEEVRATF